jgi:isopenicillin N synthase-like dioxygenase
MCGWAVSNHGVAESMMDQQFRQFKGFFNLPVDEKEKLLLVCVCPSM